MAIFHKIINFQTEIKLIKKISSQICLYKDTKFL